MWVQASVLLQGSAAAVEELAHEVLRFSLPSDPAVTLWVADTLHHHVGTQLLLLVLQLQGVPGVSTAQAVQAAPHAPQQPQDIPGLLPPPGPHQQQQ